MKHTIVVLSLALAMVGCGDGSSSDVVPQPSSDQASPFVVSVSDAVVARNTERWNDYMRLQLEAALAPLNEVQGLVPWEIPVVYDECGGLINAFYSPFDRAILLCDELVDVLYDYFSNFEGAARPGLTTQAIVFILFHEVGHALIDALDLPVFGNEESSADGIATVLAGETDRSNVVIVGGVFLSENESVSFADEHTNGEDRFGDIACWAVGSDTELMNNGDLTDLVTSFQDSGRDCVDDYQGIRQSVMDTMPALTLLEVPAETNPTILAAADPNPPKHINPQPVGNDEALFTTGNDFWLCTASVRNHSVGYRFFTDTGHFQAIADDAELFMFNYTTSEAGTLSLDYRDYDFQQGVSRVNFTSGTRFTAFSSTEGELDCEYFIASSS